MSLTDVILEGVHQLLAQAIEAEVTGWIESHKRLVDQDGHCMVVRNGRLPTRSIVTGVGPVVVTQPRVHDRRIVGENTRGEPVDANGQPIHE